MLTVPTQGLGGSDTEAEQQLGDSGEPGRDICSPVGPWSSSFCEAQKEKEIKGERGQAPGRGGGHSCRLQPRWAGGRPAPRSL